MKLVRIEQTDRETNLLRDDPDRLRQVGVVCYNDKLVAVLSERIYEHVCSQIYICAFFLGLVYHHAVRRRLTVFCRNLCILIAAIVNCQVR